MFDANQFFSGGADFYPKVINGSLRFNDDDSAYLSWTPASAGNRKTWTWSAWVKRGNLGSTMGLFSSDGTTDATKFELFISSGDQLGAQGNSANFFRTNQVFRDPSAWYHIVVVWDATNTTAEVYVNGDEVTSWSTSPNVSNQDYGINNNVEHYLGSRDGGGNNWDGYLAEVHFIDGQALDADNFGQLKSGVWVAKNYTGTYGTNGFHLTFEDDTEVEAFNTVLLRGSGATQSVTGVGFSPDLIWLKDRDNADSHTLNDTVRGVRHRLESNATDAETDDQNTALISFDSDGFTLSQYHNANGSGNDSVAWCWDAGANNASTGHSSVTYTGNGTDNHRISGLPFTPDLIWGKKRSAAGSHFLLDSVRGVNSTLSSDGTGAEDTTADIFRSFDKDGFILGSNGQSNSSGVTYVAWAWDAGDSDPVSNTDGSITSTVKSNGDFSIISYQGSGTAGDEIGHSLDAAPDFVIVKNRDATAHWNIWGNGTNFTRFGQFGTQEEQTNSAYHPTMGSTTITLPSTNDGAWNTSGQDYIMYAWRDVTGKQKFGTYTGTGSAGLSVTTGFRPGFLMIKRDGFSHWEIHDGSRDPFANPSTKLLNANQSNAEDDNANGSFEFTDTGFIVQTSHEERNNSGDTYIYAAFAGSYSDFITDYNTDGSIDSRVKANDTTGFSIVSYTGNGTTAQTVGHGLSSAPDFVIYKNRNDADTSGAANGNWIVQSTALGVNEILELNDTAAAGTDTGYFNSLRPTDTLLRFGNYNSVNGSGDDMIAYCWAEKTGYSKFGSYTGTGSNQTINFGFRPAFLLLKVTDAGDPWIILDGTRETVNDRNFVLQPNSSAVEDTDNDDVVEFTDTGVIIKSTSGWSNRNGFNYIYAAFADTREAAFWLDQSGNDNDWQPNNLDHNDTVSDSPTDNFATWNPLNKGANLVTSDGNLSVNNSTTESTHRTCVATHGMTSGKYYWEITVNNSANVDMVGVVGQNATINSGHVGTSGFAIGYSTSAGNYYKTTGWSDDGTAPPNGFPASGVIGVAFDADNKKIYFHFNGEYLNSANPTAGTGANGSYSGSEDTFFPAVSMYNNTGKWTANFGQQPFKYDPPE